MKKCFCIGAMPFDRFDMEVCGDDLIIAADAGLENCKKFNLTPDITVGDFDSLGYVPEIKNVVKLPVEKDVTDMYEAAFTALKKGYDTLYLFGGIGGRPDHTYANIAMLADLADRQCRAYLISDDYVMTALKNSLLSFDKDMKGTISVFSFTDESSGVCEKGLKYTLDGAQLTNKFPLGVSNSFIGEDSEVSVENGTLIIMYERP